MSSHDVSTTSEYRTLRVRQDDGVVVVTFDRPDRLNAISVDLIEELHDLLGRLGRDIACRVLVLTGAGRGFCAGTDLKNELDEWPEKVGAVQTRVRLQERLSELTLALREVPQPVVAAIHGPAAGGGLALAAAADVRVADETARFNAAFIRVGLSGGDVGLSWTLPRLVGMSAASELLLTGRFFDADEARRMGFVSRVVPAGEHLNAAFEMAEQIKRNSPLGVRMTKELLSRSGESPSLRSQIELENRTQILCTLTDDFAEGVAAFRERRPAAFGDV